ncbi:hypothetical protein AN8452.2 [Aspergillus nidulans FGSC A4]|uniref:GPI inositol-deacylase winged helix domain-containing protein n=1 Tax=Emericella nidulans (strain FGSC A4 / ATCC 38163 / CBS 112.46 / NRRL 194 / M139) TaxID=227321 RepID=Q5ATC8_EMENI|nr:hypothetical protein [Aspergillus nidulans FGSC A4]EAA67074.1 hypothetical protein AN8452.2 [Aspergillus nidulans FGSC A4]CBF80582.1 TPA: conserved hypothetical protein [Aspergillus nidulans FGSC A4]|eukprot:XP_681721.1 hypothetical protein AN8452.2 [Aspergillus nidulans FGSC A4]
MTHHFRNGRHGHGEIQETLNNKAQGVFRYVECQLTALKRAKNGNQLDKCQFSLPSDLDETYERILYNIHSDHAEDVRRILTILCLAKRPLTLEELIDAHAVDLEDHHASIAKVDHTTLMKTGHDVGTEQHTASSMLILMFAVG